MMGYLFDNLFRTVYYGRAGKERNNNPKLFLIAKFLFRILLIIAAFVAVKNFFKKK